MNPASLRTRLFAAVLLLPLVALATATGAVGLRCRMTGAVLSACCCPDTDGDATPANAEATVSQGDCCDRIVRELSEAPAELAAPSRLLPNLTTPVAVVNIADAGSIIRQNASSLLSSRSPTQASHGHPTVRLRLVAKSAFLI